MEVRVLEQRQNPLLKRVELQFEVDHTGAATPRRADVIGELAKQLKVPKERVVLESMHARFGIPQSRGEARLYASTEARDRVTREHILIRNGLKEKKTAAPPGEAAPTPAPAAPAAPAPAAPPAAESKPESKPEAKAEKKAEHKPEPKADHRAEPKADHKAEPNADPKAEAKVEPKAESKGGGKSAAKPSKKEG
ncbi:MAG: hypothetical protein L3J72_02040 [Thermoplasmata archaeon]|nr:hypothetical protein [Thermoplasmata archaeon]MCI4341507.1 hypothetical protein [Thermoplasmata archaeon]